MSCYPEVVVPSQEVVITCTTNMNGLGIVFIIQPTKGSSVASSESADVQFDLDRISSDKDVSLLRITSYALVRIQGSQGGAQAFTFPEDFKGLNGEPSTNSSGRYIIIFVFIHIRQFKTDFYCASFNVIPEVPFGTLAAATACLGALMGHVAIKRLRTRPS